MKTMVFLLLCSLAVFLGPSRTIPVQREDSLTSSAPSAPADTISFTAQIQPILQVKCTPCHFPGGKMYEKMPFDQSKTILDHAAGMQRRIKDGEDGRLLRAFLEQPRH